MGLLTAAAAIICLFPWTFSGALRTRVGAFLQQQEAQSGADVIVVMRGDEVRFDRPPEVAELFDKSLAPEVYVSSALDGMAASELQARGIITASTRDDLVSVLLHRGMSCSRIVVDRATPGGDIDCELRRVHAFVKDRGLTSAILVVNWMEQNWWRHRYLAPAGLEEYLKLLSFGLGLAPRFVDHPQAGNASTRLHPRSNAVLTRRLRGDRAL